MGFKSKHQLTHSLTSDELKKHTKYKENELKKILSKLFK